MAYRRPPCLRRRAYILLPPNEKGRVLLLFRLHFDVETEDAGKNEEDVQGQYARGKMLRLPFSRLGEKLVPPNEAEDEREQA